MPEIIVSPVSVLVANFKCWIFVGKFFQSHAHFFLIGFCFRFNAKRDDRLDEFDRIKDDRMVFVAKRVDVRARLQSDGRGDFAGENLLDLFAFVGLKRTMRPRRSFSPVVEL